MSKRITQYRYYSDTKEISDGVTLFDIGKQNITKEQLSVTGLSGTFSYARFTTNFPGLKIFINKQMIVIGSTGVYELNKLTSTISTISIDRASLNLLDKDINSYLIIDLISNN